MTVQPTNEIIIIIRPSFKRVCGPDACRAALYNHILYRLARKAKDEPEAKTKAGDIFWYASAEDICQDIDEAWCVNKVRKEIKQLVADGLIGQRHNPAKGWDRKYQYFIGPDQGQKLLEKTQKEEVCLLHIGLNAEVTHLLHMVNAFNKNGACICHKCEMDLPDTVDASTKYGGAIPEGSTQGSSEESTEGTEGTGNSLATLPTPAPDYRPDFSANQSRESAQQEDTHGVSHRDRHLAGPGTMGSVAQRLEPTSQEKPYKSDGNDGHSCNPALGEINEPDPSHREDSHAAVDPGTDSDAGVVRPASVELSTLTGSSPQASAHVEPKAEQEALIERPAVPEMPLQSARWCAETAVLVSEALRGKYYTASQRTNQVSKAKQMFRDFKTITRPQFEEIFTDWVKWWKDHGMGIFTLAGLLARGKDGEVRLQTSLDRLEARSMPTQPKKAGGNAVTVPKDSGMVLWQDAAGVERMMSYAEADENGWNGGFGEYIQHTHYGRTAIV